MTSCECCEKSRDGALYPLFDPKCMYCGARLIQRIQTLKRWRPPSEIRQRCAAVLADWMRYGHPETLMRQLAAEKSPPLCPEPGRAKKSESDDPTRTKRR